MTSTLIESSPEMQSTKATTTGYENSKHYLELIEEHLQRAIDADQGTLREICYHILNAGGKRIRPLLVWYSGLMFGPVSEALIQTAVAVELIHMASLIHDDIIDGASIRRNRPTVQKIWGDHLAVLSGDYLFAKAFGTLTEGKLIKTLEIMVQTVMRMCQGEILQDGDHFNTHTNLDHYYARISQKTAVLLETACKAGVLASEGNDNEVAAMGKFGHYLGLAYQIIDDILDICGDENKMGKPKYTDLIKGNLTLPLLFLQKQPEYSNWVKQIIIEKQFDRENLFRIENAVKQSGAMHQAFSVAVTYLDSARKILLQFAETPERQSMLDLTYMLQQRVY